MIVAMDGFEQFRGQAPAELALSLKSSGYTTTGRVTMATGRAVGTFCLNLGKEPATAGGGSAAQVTRKIVSTGEVISFGFAIKIEDTRAPIFVIDGLLTVDWPGKIECLGTLGAATPILGMWYYFEVVIDKANQEVRVWINNGLDLTVALPVGNQTRTEFICQWSSPAQSVQIDDFVVVDNRIGAMVQHVSRIGPVSISARAPTLDYDVTWDPAMPGSHFAMVDNTPPKKDEYIESNVSGRLDLFQSNQPLPLATQVLAVGLVARVNKTDIDGRQVGLVMGTEPALRQEHLIDELQLTPEYHYAVFESSPQGTPWDFGSVGDQAFGVIVRP